jgi:hypothetical protein
MNQIPVNRHAPLNRIAKAWIAVLGLGLTIGLFPLLCAAMDLSTTNRQALKHFWKAAEEKTGPVTVLSFGDSMADSYRSPTFHLMTRLEDRLGIAGYSLVNYRNKTLYQLEGSTTYVASPSPIWFSTYFSIPPASGVWWRNETILGGVYCDEVGIYYVRHPNGGQFTLSVSTNTGPWTPKLVVDGYSPTLVGAFTNVALSLNYFRLRVDGHSGTNYVIGPQLLNSHTNGLHVAFADMPGIALEQVLNVPASIREPIFAALKPDLLVWHMKEPIEPLRAGMEACEHWWTNMYPDCDVIYIGTPYAIQDLDGPATTNQNSIVRDVAIAYNRVYLDMMQPGVSYASLMANGLLSADGVHLTFAGGQWGGTIIWNDLGLFALSLPRRLSLNSSGEVSFVTATGATYGIQSSTNLTTWTTQFTTPGTGGEFSTNFTFPHPQTFYRLRLTP